MGAGAGHPSPRGLLRRQGAGGDRGRGRWWHLRDGGGTGEGGEGTSASSLFSSCCCWCCSSSATSSVTSSPPPPPPLPLPPPPPLPLSPPPPPTTITTTTTTTPPSVVLPAPLIPPPPSSFSILSLVSLDPIVHHSLPFPSALPPQGDRSSDDSTFDCAVPTEQQGCCGPCSLQRHRRGLEGSHRGGRGGP